MKNNTLLQIPPTLLYMGPQVNRSGLTLEHLFNWSLGLEGEFNLTGNLSDHESVLDYNGSADQVDYDLLCGTEPNWERINLFRWWIQGVISTVTAVLGLLGNILSIMVLTNKSLRNTFNLLLISLCLADSLFLFTNIYMGPENLGWTPHEWYMKVSPIMEACCHFSMSVSIFFIVSITIERYQAVCHPHHYQSRGQVQGEMVVVMQYVIPVMVLALLFNVTRFISISPWGPRLQGIPAYLHFLLFFQAFHPLTTTGIAPLFLLTSLNYKVYSHMSETRYFHSTRRRTRDFLMAKMMTVLVMVFLLLNLPRLILSLKEVTQLRKIERCFTARRPYNLTEFSYTADMFAQYCAILNSSINFIIYCMFGSEFRRNLFAKLGITSGPVNLSRNQSQPSISQNAANAERDENLAVHGIVQSEAGQLRPPGQMIRVVSQLNHTAVTEFESENVNAIQLELKVHQPATDDGARNQLDFVIKATNHQLSGDVNHGKRINGEVNHASLLPIDIRITSDQPEEAEADKHLLEGIMPLSQIIQEVKHANHIHESANPESGPGEEAKLLPGHCLEEPQKDNVNGGPPAAKTMEDGRNHVNGVVEGTKLVIHPSQESRESSLSADVTFPKADQLNRGDHHHNHVKHDAQEGGQGCCSGEIRPTNLHSGQEVLQSPNHICNGVQPAKCQEVV